jgi:hypothetical protein
LRETYAPNIWHHHHPSRQDRRQFFHASSLYTARDGKKDLYTTDGNRQRSSVEEDTEQFSTRSAVTISGRSSKTTERHKLDVSELWMHKLDPFLPIRLRSRQINKSTFPNADINALLDILRNARAEFKVAYDEREPQDLLTYMVVTHSRYDAVLYLVEKLLQFAAASEGPNSQDVLPSNLHWGRLSEKKLSQVASLVNVSVLRKSSSAPSVGLTERYETVDIVTPAKAALNYVWYFLGATIVRSANSDPPVAQALLTVIHRALALVHHLNLIPDKVYTYSPTSLSTMLQRPPIIHLLSSRILTTLSDAVWRSSQDEAISKAADSGMTYRELGQDPPGGRFRLKVRDLGPEPWLEFVLWCCVEGGFESAGLDIMEMIRIQTEDPWFAVSWTTQSTLPKTVAVDWNRVKMRTGGTVGRIEGYSGDQPLVNVPPRTISVEVVLALVEGLFKNRVQKQTERKISVLSLCNKLSRLLSFLEPHSLPIEYFDYLTVRLLQTEALDLANPPELLRSWAHTMTWLRSLEPLHTAHRPSMTFRYQSVIDHNELQAGLLHQVLQAYLHAGYPSEAVAVFNEIQRLVDGSKMHAIASFLSTPLTKADGFFHARPVKKAPDFVDSHGQLPLWRIAAVLNMVTENGLVGLGDWLLYSDDVDGPAIPRTVFGHSPIATALVRYGGENEDRTIIKAVFQAMEKWRMFPTVKYLRARANACIQALNLAGARQSLKLLKTADGGGYGPDNLAHLAASLLRLEAKPSRSAAIAGEIDQILFLMSDILDGRFNAVRSTFSQTRIILFRQQVGHLLRIFDNTPSTSINDLAFTYMSKYPSGNMANLKPETFNIILKAIVECKGADEGRRMWEMFCEDPRSAIESDQSAYLSDHFATEMDIPSDGKRDLESCLVSDKSGESSGEPTTITRAPYNLGNGQAAPSVSHDTEPPAGSTASHQTDLSPSLSLFDEPAATGPTAYDADTSVLSSDISFEADLPACLSLGKGSSRENPAGLHGRNPAVVPSIKTLRIIARGAINQQMDRRLFQGHDETANSVIKWAKEQFLAFRRPEDIGREFHISETEGAGSELSEQASPPNSSWLPAREREPLNVEKHFKPKPLTRIPWRQIDPIPAGDKASRRIVLELTPQ